MKNTVIDVAIRGATIADADAAFNVRAKSRASSYKAFLSPKAWRSFEVQNAISDENLAKWQTTAKAYIADKQTYIFRAATIDGAVVGWSLSDVRRDQIHLMRLFVDPANQGQGIGAKLLKDLYNFADNKKITLTVLKPNTRSVNFYKKHGFVELGDARYSYLGVRCVKMEKLAPHLDKIAIA